MSDIRPLATSITWRRGELSRDKRPRVSSMAASLCFSGHVVIYKNKGRQRGSQNLGGVFRQRVAAKPRLPEGSVGELSRDNRAAIPGGSSGESVRGARLVVVDASMSKRSRDINRSVGLNTLSRPTRTPVPDECPCCLPSWIQANPS